MNATEATRLLRTPSKPAKPQILIRPVYRGNSIQPAGYQSIDFEPGAVIVRNGKRYRLQKDGSQRKIKQ